MKKVIALWGVLLMFVSILPSDVVKAEDLSAVDQAKVCIDHILEAAPTPEDYSFTEALAEDVDSLGKLLQEITSLSDMEILDAYVAEKTTVEVPEDPSAEPPSDETGGGATNTITRYYTVQKFYQDYADAQNEALAALAEPIDKAIEDVLSCALVRADYESAK